MRPAMSSVSARATIASFCVPASASFCASSGRAPSRPANTAAAPAVATAVRDRRVTRLRCDAIERAALIVRDQNRAVLVHLDVRGSAPARAIGTLPPGHEILYSRRHAAGHVNATHLRARG